MSQSRRGDACALYGWMLNEIRKFPALLSPALTGSLVGGHCKRGAHVLHSQSGEHHVVNGGGAAQPAPGPQPLPALVCGGSKCHTDSTITSRDLVHSDVNAVRLHR
eukprot:1195341-Prorocentrum_minimum.AAC.1